MLRLSGTPVHFQHSLVSCNLFFSVPQLSKSKSSRAPFSSVLTWDSILCGITSRHISYCWSRPRYESLMRYTVYITRPVVSGMYTAIGTVDFPRTHGTLFNATSSLFSTSPIIRNQPSSLGLGNLGVWALLSLFWNTYQ